MKKITFKSLDSVDLTTIWPVISSDYYDLIAGTSITLTDDQLLSLGKDGKFLIGTQEISKDLIDVDTTANNTTSNIKWIEHRKKVKDKFRKKYLFMDDLVEAVTQGMELKRNVLLYGLGGHNKSEGTIETLKECGITEDKIFVKAFGDGLTTDDLFGGVKLKQALETDIMEYNVENSFMNYEVVIFEEFYDAPPNVLLALKDIMTSKKFRNGNQIFDIKCKTIIALTNRSKEEVCEDNSIAALNERFLITLKVEWPQDQYTKENFIKLAKLIYGEDYYAKFKSKINLLATIAQSSNQSNTTSFVSPRTFVQAVQLYCNGGDIKWVSDLDPTIIDKILSSDGSDVELSYKENEDLYVSLKEKCDKNNLLQLFDPATPLLTDKAFDKVNKKAKMEAMLLLFKQTVWHSNLKNKVDSIIATLNTNISNL